MLLESTLTFCFKHSTVNLSVLTDVEVVIFVVVSLRMSFEGVFKWCGQTQSYEVEVAATS